MLSERVAEQLDMPLNHADAIILQAFSSIVQAVCEGRPVKLRHFGKFEIRSRRGWRGVHPTSGRRVTIRERQFIAFAPGKTLAEKVAGHHRPEP